MEHPFKTLLYDLFVAGFVRLLQPLFARKPAPPLQKANRKNAA
jgi:hypothetical protein